MLRYVKLFAVLVFLLIWQSGAYAERLGYGIFQKMHYRYTVNNPSKNIGNPYLAGAEFIFNWADLEPEQGKFNWKMIDSAIRPWIAKNKQVILSFHTIQQKGINPTSNSATPQWVYEAGAKSIRSENTTFPVYWDNVFLKHYAGFVRAVAERYDGNPNIEFINMGIGEFGTTKLVGKKKILAEYRKYGYTEKVWSETIMKIIDIYREHFIKTPVTLILSPFNNYKKGGYGDGSETFIKAIAEYAAGKKVYLYNHSLSGRPEFANNPFMPWFDDLFKKYKDSKLILGTDNPTVTTQKYGEIGDIVKNAFGGLSVGGTYIPPTHVRYLIFYPKDIAASTKGDALYEEKYETAIKRAYELLKPK